MKKERQHGMSILKEFSDDVIDYSGLENYRSNAGNGNCICLKYLFIILNMALHN